MSQVTITRTTGNFKYTATFDLTDDVTKAILERGCVSELQSGGAISGWEKSIAYPGDAKRPKKFERSSIEFNAENAEALRKAILGNEVIVGENDKGENIVADMGATTVTVEEYSGAAAPEPKFKRAKDQVSMYLAAAGGVLKSGEPRTASTYAENRGIAAPTEPWQEDATFLAAVTAYLKAKDAEEAAE